MHFTPFDLFFIFLVMSLLFIFFPFTFISWRIITLQYCSGFCHILTWISHRFTCIPHPDPPSHLTLHPVPLGLPKGTRPKHLSYLSSFESTSEFGLQSRVKLKQFSLSLNFLICINEIFLKFYLCSNPESRTSSLEKNITIFLRGMS